MKKKKSRLFAVILAAFMVLTMMPGLTQNAYAKSRPAKVTGVKIVKQTETSVNLKWKKVNGAKKYQVHYTSSGKNGTVTAKKTSVTVKVKTTSKCTFKVRAYNGTYGSWSKTVSTKEDAKVTAARQKVKNAQKAYNAAVKAYEGKDATDFLNQHASLKTTDWDSALSGASGELGKAYQSQKNEIKNYFTVESLLKAADLVSECNELRAKDTTRVGGSKTALAIDYNQMIGAAYAGMISEDTHYHTLFMATAPADGAYGENLAWGYSDPFDGWYYGELPYYQEYLKTGTTSGEYGHYTNMTDSFSNTGLSWNPENATSCQRFGYGSGVTPEEFINALQEYAAPEKTAMDQAQNDLDQAKQELADLLK